MPGPQGRETQTPKQCRRRTGCGRKGGWQGEAESGVMRAPLNSRGGISPPNSGDRTCTALITLSRDAGLQGLPDRGVICSGVRETPLTQGATFHYWNPGTTGHSLPPVPPGKHCWARPPKRRGALGHGSQVPPAALHQCRTTTSHGWGEAGHTWGPARGKSWPTASPRDARPDSAVRRVTHSPSPRRR